MSNIGNYDERYKTFTWDQAGEELGYEPGGVLNIGWYCSDRICRQGKGDKTALIWEGLGGAEKRFTYTISASPAIPSASSCAASASTPGTGSASSWTRSPSSISASWAS